MESLQKQRYCYLAGQLTSAATRGLCKLVPNRGLEYFDSTRLTVYWKEVEDPQWGGLFSTPYIVHLGTGEERALFPPRSRTGVNMIAHKHASLEASFHFRTHMSWSPDNLKIVLVGHHVDSWGG